MKKIETMKLIKASEENKFQENLQAVIDEMQSSNLNVEISHSMCKAVKGIGYMYSAVVIGRQV